MTTLEILEFAEAQDLVKSGLYAEALPKLYRLGATYPGDMEIQDLIRKCLYPISSPASFAPTNLEEPKQGFKLSFPVIAVTIVVVLVIIMFAFPLLVSSAYTQYATADDLQQHAQQGQKVKFSAGKDELDTFYDSKLGSGATWYFRALNLKNARGITIYFGNENLNFSSGLATYYGTVTGQEFGAVIVTVDKVDGP